MSQQPPAPASPARSAVRWGPFIVSLAMGAALVGSALASYADARRTAETITRDGAERMGRTIRREVMRYQGDRRAGFEAAFEELRDQGLRFVGQVSRSGALLASAGTPAAALVPPLTWTRRGHGIVTEVLSQDLVRVWLRPGPPGGRRGAGPGMRRFQDPEGRDLWFVMDLEPVLARGIMTRAVVSLVVSMAAAAILLLAAVVLWRLARQADRYQAQLARDEQLKALGQMSAVLGHEIKNPLAALKGHAQLLLEQLPDDHAGHRGAETVVREATRIELLTKQILDFAKTGQIEREAVDPAVVARGAVERAGADPVAVHVEEGLAPWPIDRARMEQVLVNLLCNARQATEDGAPVELSVGRGGELLIIEVSDRGQGLAAGVEEQIFEPFHTTRTKGSGLGLAFARRVVEGHGGRISAANRPGGGARFRIELPRG